MTKPVKNSGPDEKETPAPTATTTPPAPAETPPTVLPAPPPVESVPAGELNAGVEMPAPNERTIAAVAADSTAPAGGGQSVTYARAKARKEEQAARDTPPADGGPAPGELDTWNRPYDPAKNFPRKDTLGRWVVRRATAGKPGVPAASPPAGAPQSFVGEPGQPMPPMSGPGRAPGPDKYELAAEMYCRTFYGLTDMAFDGAGEWYPENDGEHTGLKTAAAAYLRFKQSDDLPPALALALAVGIYAAPRFVKPRTKARVAKVLALVRTEGRTDETIPLAPPVAPPPSVPPAGQEGVATRISQIVTGGIG